METWQHLGLLGLAASVGTFAGYLAYNHFPDVLDEATSVETLIAVCFLGIVGGFFAVGGLTYLVGLGLALPRYRGLALHACTAVLLASYAPWVKWLRAVGLGYERAHGKYLAAVTVRQFGFLRRHALFGMGAAVLIYLGHLTR